MATGVIRNFLIQAPAPPCFPLMFQHSPCKDDNKGEMLEDELEARGDEGEEEEDESEAQEEEEVFLNAPHCALDLTKQLLGFADLISRDVQRYFGRTSGDQDACDIYSDSKSATAGGRLRYYDDLLRIARAGSPEEEAGESFVRCGDEHGGAVATDSSSLGPLAELFELRGPNQDRSRPMTKRHLPLSFWNEPIACCSEVGFGNAPEVCHTNGDAPQDGHTDCNTLSQHNTHPLDGTQPDFSDLLANWDPNPELSHTLTDNTHMQH